VALADIEKKIIQEAQREADRILAEAGTRQETVMQQFKKQQAAEKITEQNGIGGKDQAFADQHGDDQGNDVKY